MQQRLGTPMAYQPSDAGTARGGGAIEHAHPLREASTHPTGLWRQLAIRAGVDQPIGRMRLAFLSFSVLSVLALGPIGRLGAHGGPWLAGAAMAAAPLLAAKWLWEHAYHPPPVAGDVVEGLGLTILALAVGQPLLVLILLFARISYRALDATAPRAALLLVLYVAAFVAPGITAGPASTGVSLLALAFLSMGFPLSAVVMHLLGASLRHLADMTAREKALRRELVGRERDEQAHVLLQHASDVIAFIDEQAVVRYASPATTALLGIETGQFIGQTAAAMIHPDDAPAVLDAVRAVRASADATRAVDVRVRSVRDGWRDVSLIANAVRNSPLGSGLVVTVHDVTERRRAEVALAERERSFRLLFDRHPHPMWVYDRETLQFIAVNDAAVTRYGYTREEFLGMTIAHLRPPEDVPRLLDQLTDDRPVLQTRARWRHQLKDGRVIDVELSSHTQEFAGRPAVLVLAQDVTERAALEAQLQYRAFHDALTGLANRASFAEAASGLIADAPVEPGCAVLLIDLDNFKTVNDTMGHLAGDEVLAIVGQRLAGAVRGSDLAARLGGDEFAVLLGCVAGADEAVEVAERIRALMTTPFPVRNRHIELSCTIGVALLGDDARDYDALLHCADLAMFVAKGEGKARVRGYEPQMGADALARAALTADLRRAVAAGQFHLLYQPQVDIAGGRISGVEALVRWDHPVRGTVPPDEFIPLAEEVGLIGDIDAWVLREAASQAARWRDAGLPPLRLSVNVSGNELDGELADRVEACLGGSGLDFALVELEVTESAAVRHHEEALRALSAIRARGLRVAVDDFGTGYSALNRLRHLPIDRVKIDKSFVQEIGHRSEQAPIVAAMIVMAHSLGLEVVAEGVETPDQLALLARHGCDTVQGYLTCRPLPAEQVTRLFSDQSLDLAMADLLQRADAADALVFDLVSSEVGFDDLATTLLGDVVHRLDCAAATVTITDWVEGMQEVVASVSRGAVDLPVGTLLALGDASGLLAIRRDAPVPAALADRGVISRVAVPLVTVDGTVLGELSALDPHDGGPDDLVLPLLQLYARVLAATRGAPAHREYS